MSSSQPTSSTVNQTVELDSVTSTSLLDQILSGVQQVAPRDPASANTPRPAPLPWDDIIRKWLRNAAAQNIPIAKLRRKLALEIGHIDMLLNQQVNAILHHPQFQELESQWRGLEILCNRAADLYREVEADNNVVKTQIRILSVTKRELWKDFDRAIEFDQNNLFKKVYEEEFGMSGGTPYGLLLANFEFTNHPDDLDLLEQLAGVGAAAFCPLITSASASMLGLESLSRLEQPYDIQSVMQQTKYRRWLSLRKNPDTQFLGVTLPRVLMRVPYEDDGGNRPGFRFREEVEAKNQDNYLWGPASWAFACVVMRAFMHAGWFADIRGMQRGIDGGGIVSEFPVHSFRTDQSTAAQKTSVETSISDQLENQISQAGFIPLSNSKDTPYSVFYSNQSVHEPTVFNDKAATMNARVSAMLQYVLCCSRVAHFLRIEARNKIGSTQSARDVEDHLNRWITRYVTPDTNAPASLKAEYPLQKAEVLVEELPGKPGEFRVVIHLLPHYQLDSLSSTMTLTARNVSAAGA